MQIKFSLGFTLAVYGFFSGVLSFFSTSIPIVGRFFGPGIVFSIVIIYFFWKVLKSPLLILPSLSWIGISTIAYFSAYNIGVGSIDLFAPSNAVYSNELSYYFSFILAGLTGGFIMLLGVRYCLFFLTFKQIIALTLLAGFLGISGWESLHLIILFVTWQTGMTAALGYIIENKVKSTPLKN